MLARGELHNFCARILGWTSDRAVDLALRSIDLAAALRLVALRASRNMSRAAAWLGMTPVSLSRWVGRRRLPPKIPRDRIEPCSPTTMAIATIGSHGSRR